MSDKIRKGSKVTFPAGRGRGTGTVVSIDGPTAVVKTSNGKELARAVSGLALAKKGNEEE